MQWPIKLQFVLLDASGISKVGVIRHGGGASQWRISTCRLLVSIQQLFEAEC